MNSFPKHPELILNPPPIVPGIHDKNSKPPMLFSIAKFDKFLSDTALPATIILFCNNEIFEKFLPSFTTKPSNLLSVIRIFDPAPKTKIFSLFPKVLRKVTKSSKLSGLKKTFASPPILNQFNFLRL